MSVFRSFVFLAYFLVLQLDASVAQEPPVAEPAQVEPAVALPTGALLQGLDKVTARISTFNAPVDQPVKFGALRITVRNCYKRPPEELPESAAFLEIEDLGADGDAITVFSGWMFASSPALSAMEHPVYDVWVVDCMKASISSSDSAP